MEPLAASTTGMKVNCAKLERKNDGSRSRRSWKRHTREISGGTSRNVAARRCYGRSSVLMFSGGEPSERYGIRHRGRLGQIALTGLVLVTRSKSAVSSSEILLETNRRLIGDGT